MITVGFLLLGQSEGLSQVSNIRERGNRLLWSQIRGMEKEAQEAR